MKPNARKDDTISALVKRARSRRDADRQWMLTFDELAHYFHTFRKGFVTEHAQAEDLQQDIWCSEPEFARRKLAEDLVASMCPQDRIWPGVVPANRALLQIREVRMWCEEVGKILYAILYDPRVCFTERMGEIADDISALGTSVSYVDHDSKNKMLSMAVKWLKDFSFETDGKGNVTATYCWMMWPLGTIVDEFGMENLPKDLQEEWRKPDSSSEKCYEILHVVMPRAEYERYGLGPQRLPLKSIWIATNFLDEGSLAEGGYYTQPYVVSRWYRTSREAWGRSPAMVVLPDARLAQSVAAALLEITEKQGNPPMQGPIDILRGEIELFPGGFTPFDSSGFQFQGDPLRPVQIGANPAMTAEYLQYLERKIGKGFFNDAMSLPENDGKSTMEDAAAWQLRRAKVLGPIYSRVQNEALPPILDRVFDIALRTGTLPQIPDQLSGQRLEYKFDNYVADMIEMAEAERALNAVALTAQFERPEIDDNLNWDSFLRETWQKMKVSDRHIRPMEEVEANREQRQQMQQAAQMAEIAKNAGPGLKSGVEALQQAQGGGLVPQQ
jgi:hypothetical protein